VSHVIVGAISGRLPGVDDLTHPPLGPAEGTL
jgi:hypothetical protein